MNENRKKALKNAYKTRKVVGGVYRVLCTGNGRVWLNATTDLAGLENRYAFARSMNGPLDPSMRREWEQYGTEAFSLTVLEEMEKGETQTDREFSDDIDALLALWTEKLAGESTPAK